ncbi:MAG TPA: aldo/keto reductase [Polyangiaceae bacterium]|jgi:aryl-alcohol dehydrogenase-like predicted oxidoreductase
MADDSIPTRVLGKTGARVSVLGFGGHHLGDAESADTATDLVHAAVDAGITFFDNCWEYHNGKSEVWMGRALAGKRDKVFLMTKVCTHGRSADLAMSMLETSLRRLQTDHLDLWQIHGVAFDNDPERAFAKGGVIEALDQAKRQGKVRFVGFTGHKDPAIHLKMLSYKYPFDTVQMPLNCFDASFRSFERDVLPEAVKQGVAPLGMKPMTGRASPVKLGVVSAEEMLRYAMSLPGIALTITGMESRERLEQNLRIARGFKPMSEGDLQALRDRCQGTAADGRFEPYKVSLQFDNPEARLAHDFPIDAQEKEVKEQLNLATGKETAK